MGGARRTFRVERRGGAPRMTALAAAIARHAIETPDGLAIDGGIGNLLTWRMLDRALPAAVAMVRQGLGGGGPVGLSLDQGAGTCLMDIALAEAGIASVPLPAFFTEEQRAQALAAAGCRAVVTAAAIRLQTTTQAVLDYQVDILAPSPAALPEGTIKISFTSGSTGQPKGICLSAAHLIGVAQAVVDFLGSDHAGRHLPVLSPAILLENVAGLYASILAGGTYVALPSDQTGFGNPFRPDFAVLLSMIEAQTITSLILVPEYLAGLVAAMEKRGARLPRLTLVAVGGARVAPALLHRAAAVGLPVRQGYGLTECGSVVCLERGMERDRGGVGGSIGFNRVELAEDGEILIHGPVCLGTIGAPRAPGPLHSGDLGRMGPDGSLVIEGRKTNLIVTSFGRNVSPEWVESVLMARPEIAQILVRGDGAAALDALIVPASPEADIASAVDIGNRGLPAYAQIDRWRVVPPFTPFNAMLTGNGRLRRDVIQSAYPEAQDDMPFFDRLVAETREAQARFLAVPQLQAGFTGRISRGDYIAYLTQAYHHVRHTVPLMQEARSRLTHRPALIAALDDYIEEETGHEFWILDDIAAAGGDREIAAASEPEPATAAMVDHAYRVIRHGNPAAFFGMVYVLEGTSIAMASNGASAVQRSLALPNDAMRYLTSHGSLDQEHMVFFEALMNRTDDAGDQAAIIAMARDMFGLFGGLFASIELEAAHELA